MRENVIKGLIGAILGSIIGGLVVFILARMGYVSKIGTVVFGLTIVFGYQKFAGNFSMIGAILCTILSAAVTYFIFTLVTTYDIYPLLEGTYLEDMTFWECFKSLKDIMKEADALNTYNHNLILMELMGIGGTIAFSYSLLKGDDNN